MQGQHSIATQNSTRESFAVLAAQYPVFESNALAQTLLASDYAAQVLAIQTEALIAAYQRGDFAQAWSFDQIQQQVQTVLATASTEAAWMQALRQLRQRLMFRWIWRDANQLTDVVQMTRELSDFADISIQAAVAYARQPLIEKYGEPIGADGQCQALIVIGMGKLGAQELNLSSDIDLIFAFDEAGETNGKRCIEVQQFMIYWGQAVIRLLDQNTPDGFVWRVDMRLRPWGDGSALALSHAALERYLEKHGREWERYAWIKARLITGGRAGEQLLAMTRPFVFRRYVDYSAFAAMRDMKSMIAREVMRRNLQDDVKLGSGGIREIEFIVQAFQLIQGGARRELRGVHCLQMLSCLGELNMLPMDQVVQLRAAYVFLRRLEHAIQAMHDQQTQQLPQDPVIQQRIAWAMGLADWQVLVQVLEQHREVVRHGFAEVIADRCPDEDGLEAEQLEPRLLARLDAAAQQQLEALWSPKQLAKLPEQAVQRLRRVWPHLLQALLRLDDPQNALLRLLPLLEKVLRRSVYLVMLIENTGALFRLVKMLAASPWISAELVRYPVLLDEFMSADLNHLPTRADLADRLRQQLLRIERDDIEGQMRELRLFKKSEVLAVAASDVLAERPLMKVSDALTDIAEVVLDAALNLALGAMVERHGLPIRIDGTRATMDAPAFAVVGYGKLGGIELGYSSDLDIVFLHDVDEQSDTDGGKPISGMEFCTRLAQKVMTLLTTQTLDGRAYEIDTRLRPSGHAGMLVVSLKSFAQYQLKGAWLWEHQALVRARGACGGQRVLAAFDQIRREILTLPRDEAVVREEVRNMRQKMKDHLGSSKTQRDAGIFHLKHDAGGIVDIEFMAQYGVLAWSAANPDLARYSDNVRLLDDLATAGRLSRADADVLTDAYLRERAETHRLALAQQPLTVEAGAWHDTRKTVYDLWTRLIDPTAIALDD
ncbi:MAG: bifunctional [glutamate--ammonia ligase]-adenylyl-L-tyrosine phosphorylase/[glutamate--ammonia-ligase] adenylyltransferase [Pseudomonadota bacterium]|nr:bifunctional [glutamate--ammonia ligase]-adenylyl-L-tyrosine phosphorylase/[glutamate--ammonia-ligase] adenylyltransferase [Pseudomonadota bacterium]